MSEGRISVGHPVDVGSGAVFTKKRDFELPGTIGLDWVRHYDTNCHENSWLGRGWTVPFFMRLERREDGFLLIDEIGRPILFASVGGSLQVGERLVSFGANMELQREADQFQIVHWHIDNNEVERYVFKPSDTGRMPLAWIENLAGHRISIQYDEQSRPIWITQELEGRVLELSYNFQDLLTEVNLISGQARRRLVSYAYDPLRRLISSADALGNECTYGYDEQHRLTAEGNPLGSTFRFRYDDQGKCIYASGDDRYMERTLVYLSAARTTRVSDSLKNVTQYVLNAAGQVIQAISPLGATTTNNYDEYGRITKITHPDGGVVSYEYDNRGNRKAFVDESGGTSTLTHNDLHLITGFVDAMGSKWEWEYDQRGNLLSLTNPLGNRLECVRDERGLVLESRRPGGLILRRRYGANLRSMELADQISLVFRLEVDEFGSQTALYDAKGLVRRLRNDALGRPIEVTDALGRTSRLAYNANSEILERVLTGNQWERWEYDRFGRLTAHINAAGLMRLEYDAEDHLLAVINRAGERLTRMYDADGRIVAETSFDGREERHEYTPEGFRRRTIKADGRFVELTFDKAGRMLTRTSSDGIDEKYGYDGNARLVLAQNLDSTVELKRNELGQVVAEIQSGRRVEYAFDADNNRISRRLPGISPVGLGLRYDIRGRLIAVEDEGGPCQELIWDAGDQLIERRLPGGAFERFVYDDVRRLRRHEFLSPLAGRVLDRVFDYDDRDNEAVREDSTTGRSEFRYDSISRLTEVSRNGTPAESYEYDGTGTLLATHRGPRAVSTGGRVLTDGPRRYEYGPDGAVAAVESAEGHYRLSHNVDGQLVAVTLPDGREARYAYDPFGRRVRKEVDGARTEFVWQSCDLAAELTQNTPPRTFLHYYQKPLAQWSGGERQVPIVDRNGAPEVLVDEHGEPLWRADYEAYGLLTRESGRAASPFRFRGQYHDRETGFYYNFHRYYAPGLAGYLEPDPLGLTAGSNFYLYPRNPLLWDDPFGLTCSNKHSGQMGEAEMDAHYAALGYTKLGSHDAPAGGGPGRPQGIDGVYYNPNGTPPYVIAEAKYGSSGLGTTTYSGGQMSDQWIDTGIGNPTTPSAATSRLESAVGPTNAAAIQNSAATNPGSVQKQVFNLPAPGTSGTGSVTRTNNYTPGSGNTTF